MSGTVGVLNVGAGDVKLTFDKENPAETIRAARIVKDMMRRGYALLVRTEDGTYLRAKDFDEKTNEYIVADFDPSAGVTHDAQEESADVVPAQANAPTPARGRRKRIPAEKTHGVAVSRTAGG